MLVHLSQHLYIITIFIPKSLLKFPNHFHQAGFDCVKTLYCFPLSFIYFILNYFINYVIIQHRDKYICISKNPKIYPPLFYLALNLKHGYGQPDKNLYLYFRNAVHFVLLNYFFLIFNLIFFNLNLFCKHNHQQQDF